MHGLLGRPVEDLTVLRVSRTPTFFVNGRSLPSFRPDRRVCLGA